MFIKCHYLKIYHQHQHLPAGIYLLTVNDRNTRTRCEICSKLIIKTPERRQWHRSCVFIVNFEHISHLVLVFLLLTLNKNMSAGLMPILHSEEITERITSYSWEKKDGKRTGHAMRQVKRCSIKNDTCTDCILRVVAKFR